MSKLYAEGEGSPSVLTCSPEFCERIEGVGDGTWTLREQWEEASPGCPRRCQNIKEEDEEEDENFSDDELGIWTLEIETLADEHRVFPVKPETLSYFQSECLIYLLKTEREFERQIGVTLRIVAASFLKQ